MKHPDSTPSLPVPPFEAAPARAAMRSAWLAERQNGTGAVLVAYANAAALEQFDWRRPGHATDPMRHAQALYETGCREGWLNAA